MAKKWTKAEREAASIAGKKRWAARKLGATTATYALKVPVTADNQRLAVAIDIARLIENGGDRSAIIVRVVDRLLQP